MADFGMTLGWVIVYVDDPPESAAWYERVFGMPVEFAFETYAQLDTGSTKLGFAAYSLGGQNFEGGVRRSSEDQPANVEIALVHADVDGAFQHALDAGCSALAAPTDKPQGQRVAYVRDPFGTLVELATPL
jgi:catechol 2,3-dioxygenase-like lactoylglutathione lyase family enzyme